jgi:hypothetical protein
MDPRVNPYAPGAGTFPPELTGRDKIIEKALLALDRCRNGLPARGLLITGLRGVGKTVLLNYLAQTSEATGFAVVSLEMPEKRSLPALLIPALRSTLMRLDRMAGVGDLVKKALHVLGGFVAAMKLKYQDVEFNVDLGRAPGIADSGNFEYDLMELFIEIGHAVKEKKTAFVLFIDEIQYLEEEQFAALIMSMHKCAQHRLPVLLMGAGLPQLVGQAGRSKSYAERLFEYTELGPLNETAAKEALQLPARKLHVEYEENALTEILTQTQSYPYFLQEWGNLSWQCALQSPITANDVKLATELAIVELDQGFFRVRYDRLTPTEKKYLRAMAELGPGPHRSGDIAHLLQKEVQAVAPTRAALISKGMIYSPYHGDNAFTVPLFNDFMKRAMPEFISGI